MLVCKKKGGTLERLIEHTANYKNAEHYLAMAAKIAKGSLCLNRMCGAAIVRFEATLAVAYNAPAGGNLNNRKCLIDFPLENRKKPKAGITCCMHAEHIAILSALKAKHDLNGSTMYFVCVNKEGVIIPSGKPYCVDCAKLALHVGIGYWVLQHAEGITRYDAKEYYDISIQYHFEQKSLS